MRDNPDSARQVRAERVEAKRTPVDADAKAFEECLLSGIRKQRPDLMRGNEPGPEGDPDPRSPDEQFRDVVTAIRTQMKE